MRLNEPPRNCCFQPETRGFCGGARARAGNFGFGILWWLALAAGLAQSAATTLALAAEMQRETEGVEFFEKKIGEFDLEKRRRQHWAWRSIQSQKPPAVKNRAWVRNPVDQFILAKLEEAGLSPAPTADKRTFLRRLYFDLVGLPPSPSEVEDFVHDSSNGAYENVVDRLLSSPQFGERWARHWLDLVRYAETLGHEYDYAIPNAWRYRDYVIRAFNADVPYDRFVTEHIAGDLLSNPRLHPTDGSNESIIGTAFYWFGQQTHSPVDVRQHQAEVIENQIDVLTKTFLGLTVACARCHDHKFDAISSRDYYALYGVMTSSRYAQRSINAGSVTEQAERLRALKAELRIALLEVWSSQLMNVRQYLLAAREVQADQSKSGEAAASRFNLDAECLSRWVDALSQSSTSTSGHPMQLWKRFATRAATNSAQAAQEPGTGGDAQLDSLKEQWQALVATMKQPVQTDSSNALGSSLFADFRIQDYHGWFLDGEAFGSAPSPAGEWIVGDVQQPVAVLLREPSAHSATLSRQLQGTLRSPTFTITNRYLHLRVAGRESRINVFIDNFALIQNPIYGSLRHVLDHDEFRWLTIDASMWLDHRAYLEFSDLSTPDLAGGGKTDGYGTRGYISVSRILFSDDKTPPAEATSGTALTLLGEAPVNSVQALANRYQRAALDAMEAWASGTLDNSDKHQAEIALLDWLIQNRLLDVSDEPLADKTGGLSRSVGRAVGSSKQNESSPGLEIVPPGSGETKAVRRTSADTRAHARVARLLEQFHQVESSFPIPSHTPAMADGNGLDERVFIRGNPATLGEIVPRRFLQAMSGSHQPIFQQGSGRLELAQSLTDPSNPFLSRVMVNRIWHYLFGRGLVPTPDDFGALGQPPSHPELLDWLASYFRDDARWSSKRLIRLLVTSSAYRMSSQSSDSFAEEKDADNALLHRMPVRRAEGEVIRDFLLASSGRLDRSMFGPSVPVHLNEFMDGRGRPAKSGPLDGAGRRSIYLEVRRNFLSPMMRTFDAPVPFTTVGRRTVSNVPAQSLILMNDPFVVGQSRAWAQRLLARADLSPEGRIGAIFLAALSRPPSRTELAEALEFLDTQAKAYGFEGEDRLGHEALWTDFCQVIFNTKEFVFVN